MGKQKRAKHSSGSTADYRMKILNGGPKEWNIPAHQHGIRQHCICFLQNE